MDLETLGAALRERREALGIPRAELSRRVGVSPTYVWLIEEAKPRKSGTPSRPARDVLERWTRALGMDDRYTRRALVWAGYEREDRSLPYSQGRADLARAVQPATPPRYAMDRAAAPLPPAAAPMQTETADFASAPMNFPQPRDLHGEVLVDRVREVLERARPSKDRWEEATHLLESFLDWLHFHIESGEDPHPPAPSPPAVGEGEGRNR